MNRERAILQGIDSARVYRKDGPWPYHEQHPLFHYFWEGCVLKSDCPWLSDKQIIKDVMARLEKKWGRSDTLDAKGVRPYRNAA